MAAQPLLWGAAMARPDVFRCPWPSDDEALSSPGDEALSSPDSDLLSPFARLLVIRCLRKDVLLPAAHEYVAAVLGATFEALPPADMASCFAESSCCAPLLYVLSPGSDPTAAMLNFAAETGNAAKVSVVSMGQGQVRTDLLDVRAARTFDVSTWVSHCALQRLPRTSCCGRSSHPQHLPRSFRAFCRAQKQQN